ncbi:hypothetical protein [Streptomyces hygroscopicus]|uniref:hypothetical protein n=1 Tax=Streptomyces hygroscopicus TaxID=1912 RepID=UPI001FCB5E51|nr:hypothetical protein [Streptomyces hygroscopicus]
MTSSPTSSGTTAALYLLAADGQLLRNHGGNPVSAAARCGQPVSSSASGPFSGLPP